MLADKLRLHAGRSVSWLLWEDTDEEGWYTLPLAWERIEFIERWSGVASIAAYRVSGALRSCVTSRWPSMPVSAPNESSTPARRSAAPA